MMPAPSSLASSLALLLLWGAVRAGPFSPPSNMTLPAPRPPPRPGGRTAEPRAGNPSSQLYEHTVEGGEKQVVFTHRINLPPSAACGCPPGSEPPVPASEVQALRVRLEILEELVKGLKEQCTGGCCPAAAQAGTGQTDVRSLCSRHGVFDLTRCACSCEPGWGGPTCSDPTDSQVSPPSPSGSCPDDCNDQGRCVRGRCVCFSGYTGPSCGWPSCPGDCQGHGRCVRGVCVCRPGFSGADCSQRSCPRGCSQRGRCENGRCVCHPGYTGEDCAARSCPRGCSQRGRCEDGRCVCDPGYTGEDCGSRTCPRDCGDGGRCVDGRCVCWPGYAGEDCGARTCPRDCRGRGRCEDGECICDAGYSGDDCGVRSCPGDCSQRGRCEDGRCVCWPGYTGPDCGARACPRDCRGRGRCEDGVCVCSAGFSGEDCGARSCPGNCGGRGRCESGRCVCWPGYTGRDCGARACPGDCRGRGRCADGRCVCDPGFTGEDCGSRRCPGDCRGRGRCEDGVCLCDAGFEGEDCGARSCPGGCRGRGQCLDGRCVCDDGFAGEDCGARRCPQDCSQRGVCRDGVCACREGFAGEDCGLRTCPFDCHGRGRCEDGRCVCDSGYTGPSCATRLCPDDCRGRGRCVQGACVCHAGYSGADCGREEPPAGACPGGCGPRELCRAGQCVCVEGFRGPDCAIQTCPGDCRGRGECREGSCVCQEGFAGEDCGEEVPAIEGMRMHLLEETTVRTEWTRAPGPVDAYEIQFIPTPEGASPPFTARVPSSASAYDQRGLAPGQEYQVTVRALRGTNWGPPASKTITTMIDGPQDLRVVAVTPTTLALSWLRPQAEVDRFVVSYVSAGNQRVRLEVPAGADGTLLTDLMPGVEYVVTVTAERGRAVSYPASVRANTAPGHHSHPEVRPPAPPPRPRPGPAPRPPRPPRPTEEGPKEARPGPGAPPPSRRPWGDLPAELSRFRGSAQDLERHLRARGFPLRANQTYASAARLIHAYLQRRRAAGAPGSPGSPAPSAPPARRPAPTAGPWKPDSHLGIYGLSPEGVDGVAGPRHPKPEVLGSSADGSLLVSLDGLRGHFERVVLRWQPQPPAEGARGELSVPGSARTASLPGLLPGTTYHVEVHGVRAGRTSKSYAFITTTGSAPSGLLGATDEPPPSGPATTQGAQAPGLQQRPQELGELRVLGRDDAGRLRVAWMAQPDTFDRFQLHLRVSGGPGSHDQILPGDVRQALLPSPPPGAPYELSLRGVSPEGEPSAPLIYQGVMDSDGEKPGQPLAPPRLGELTAADVTSSSLRLHWTVPQGEFDSFTIQYKDRDRPRVVPVEGPQRSALVTGLDGGRKYKFVLYGFVGKKRHGPLVAEAKTVPRSEPSPEAPPRLGTLRVTEPTPHSLRLSWTVPEGRFDSFVVQYRDRDGRPQTVPVEGPERSVTVSPLDADRTYRFSLFGIASKRRHGPLVAEGTTAAQEAVEETPRPTEPSTEAPQPPVEPRLGELTVTGSSPDSLSLAWTVPEGQFDHFLVQYKNGDGQPKAVRVPGHEAGVTISGLEPAHKYKMHLYGVHAGQRLGPASATGVTEDEPPGPPEPSAEEPVLGQLTVTGASPDSLSLAWTVARGHFDAFTVQYKDRDGRPQVVRVGGEESAVTVRGLEPGRKYKMHLYGLQGGRRVGPAAALGLTAPPGAAPAATEPSPGPRLGALTVTGVTPRSVGLAWTVPEGQFDSFEVQFEDRDGQLRTVPVAADQREATVPGLEPAHGYRMLLYGLHGGQRRGPLSVDALTAPAAERPEPRLGELTVTGVTPSSVGLAWTVPEGEFDSFAVQYEDGAGRPQVLPVAGGLREASVRGLDAARTYELLLYGLHRGRRLGPLSALAVTAPREDDGAGATAPSPAEAEPQLGGLTVVQATPHSLRLSWTVTEGQLDSFEVQYTDQEGQRRAVSAGGGRRDVTLSGLQADHRYRVELYGIRGPQRLGPVRVEALTVPRDNEEEPTEPPTTTPQPPVEPRLGELTVTGSSPDSLSLAWTVPEGQFDHFLVQYKNGDGQPKAVRVPGHEAGVTISGLEPAHKYKMHLYGVHAGQRQGPASATGVTEDEPPGPPEPSAEEPELGQLTVTGASPDSLSLAWTVARGHFDAFTVQYKDRDGRPQVVRVGGEESAVTVRGLEPGRKYKMHLYGLQGGRRVGPAAALGLTARPAPDFEAVTTQVPPTTTPQPPVEPRLGELTVTGSSPDSLSLAWTVPEGQFDHFLVQYKNGDGQPKAVRVPGHEAGVTISGLEPAHKYKMHLYGVHAGQRQGPASATGVTEDEPPGPPEPSAEEPVLGQLTVTGASPDSLSLAWTVARGHFDAFTVQYKDRDGRPQVVRVGGEESEVTVRGLEPGRKYKMHLYGLQGGRRVGPAAALGLTAPEAEPPTGAPVEPRLGELTVTGSSPDSLSLAWTVPEGQFDHFLVQYKNGDGQPKAVRVPGHEAGVTISGLEPAHKYKMHLYGVHAGQRQGPASATGVTEDEPPGPPEPSAEEPVLGQLTVTGSSPDSLSLAWTVARGHFDAFTVQYKDRDGRPQVVRVGGEESEVTVRGLEPGRKYKMHLYGLQGGRRVGPAAALGLTARPAPDFEAVTTQVPPTTTPQPPVEPRLGELTVTGSSPDSLSLAWTVPEGQFDHFLVQYKNGDGQPKAVRVPGHEAGVTISGLEPAHKYKMHLYGVHAGQRLGPASATGVTEDEPPGPPEPSAEEPVLGQLTVTGASPDSLSLAWTVARGHFDAFTVQYKDRDGRPQVVRVGGEESAVTVRGLEPGRKYKMHLYGLQGGRRVGPAAALGLTARPAPDFEAVTTQVPPSTTPQPPVEPRLGELTVTGSSPDSLSLAWTVPEGQFDHFLVQYKNGDGQPKAVRVPGHEAGVTISGLEPAHKYKMHLYGVHAGQRVGPASATGVTEDEPPGPPEPSAEEPVLGQLTVTGASPDSLSLAWTVARGHFDAFTVQYKDRDGRPQVVRVGGEESAVTVRGLEPGRKYKMHLYGLQGGRRVGPVAALGLTAALPPAPPGAPRLEELAVAAVTADSVHLSWMAAGGPFDSFLVQYQDAQGQPQAVPLGGGLREATVSGLAPAHKYRFLLFGVRDGQRHGPLSADAKTIPDAKPPRLGELTVTAVTPDSVGLSWTVPQGTFDSFVVQYKDRHGQPRAVPVAADQREATVSGLEPHRKYRFLLYGLAGSQQLGPVSAEGTTAPEEDTPAPWQAATEAPKTPGGPRLGELAVTDSAPDSLRLAWTGARGPFDSFVVQYWDADRQPQALLVGGDQDEVRVSGLEPSTPYKFFLYGLHHGRRLGPVSAEGTTGSAPAGRTPGEPGPRLSQLSVTDVTTSSMRLSWEAPPGAFDSFLLRYGVPAASTLEPHPRPLLQREVTVPGSQLSAVLRDLRPGTLYSLTLYGLRGPHQADSVQGTARTLSPVLESPRDLQFSEIGETSVKVSWTPPLSRADSFKVSYQLVDGGEPRSVQVSGAARTQQLQGLVPGAHYEVTVVSVRGFEESEPLTGFLTTVPDGPTQLRALNLTEGTAQLHWKPPQAPVDTYAVMVTAPGAPPLQASAPGSAVDYPLQGLELHTNYTATVHGLRGPNLTSAASITFTTGLEGPQDLEAKEVTPRTALLTWTEPQVLPTGYVLSYDAPDGPTQEILLPGSATSHQLRGLFPATSYRARLRAVWGEGLSPPVSTAFTTGGLQVPFPRDCGEEMQNGAGNSRTTTIFLNGDRARPLDVFCDMETDGGGWLVFQRRMDGRTDFWRDWEDYAHGFGNLSGEFWLGNEALHSLTSAGDYSMRVDLRAGAEVAFAQYDSFRVDSAADYYRLHLEGYRGTAGDSMSYHSGSVFSARDRDPNNLLISCAVSYRGAWWYRNCHYANLNGLYGSTVDHQGVSWYHWKGFEFSVPFTEMKLRPRGYRAPAGGG
uniref:Tenascin XB n=1 Tax=Pipistrellus kuhlii TaxID=59472 RepID=A0A7J7YMT5_PIPKU|nr:hypothetical protein mPipKuh1_010169 [Pipistrellus kuhlii]